MPFKTDFDRRHHIPEQRHKVTNWSDYDAGLRQRGSSTVWFTEEAATALQSRQPDKALFSLVHRLLAPRQQAQAIRVL
jgi:hypothetical protein